MYLLVKKNSILDELEIGKNYNLLCRSKMSLDDVLLPKNYCTILNKLKDYLFTDFNCFEDKIYRINLVYPKSEFSQYRQLRFRVQNIHIKQEVTNEELISIIDNSEVFADMSELELYRIFEFHRDNPIHSEVIKELVRQRYLKKVHRKNLEKIKNEKGKRVHKYKDPTRDSKVYINPKTMEYIDEVFIEKYISVINRGSLIYKKDLSKEFIDEYHIQCKDSCDKKPKEERPIAKSGELTNVIETLNPINVPGKIKTKVLKSFLENNIVNYDELLSNANRLPVICTMENQITDNRLRLEMMKVDKKYLELKERDNMYSNAFANRKKILKNSIYGTMKNK